MNMQPRKHYSFSAAGSAWHLIADQRGLMYILIVQPSYPQRSAHAALEETQKSFVAKAGDKASTAYDNSLNSTCRTLLQRICAKFDNLAEVDRLSAVTQKVDSVKLVMMDNVDMALQNCVKLESIEKAAEELQNQAGVFKRSATDLKKKMWWKNIKLKLIIAFIALCILGGIIGIIVYLTKK